jgi:hypothetical protein
MAIKDYLRKLGIEIKKMDPPPPQWRKYKDARISIRMRGDDLWIMADTIGYQYLGQLFTVLSRQSEETFDHLHLGPELELTAESISVIVSCWREELETRGE